MTFVLVHGGGFAGSCWERLVLLLDGDVHVVDLPGRGNRPADLGTVTIDANLGDVDVVDLDTSHMAMVTDPVGLAAILNSL